jgi:LmbE family N-acetylglucosaminyl deacetylase
VRRGDEYLLLSLGKTHHMVMFAGLRLRKFGCGLRRKHIAAIMGLGLLGAMFAAWGSAQTGERGSAKQTAEHGGDNGVDHYYDPLPQETGDAGLKLMLRRLQTTGRLMQTVAHPDDEDGGMLTLEARGQGVSTLLMTLNRGEGGQNKLGSNLFDGLGVLRTLELLAADRYYGVEQRFSRVADFGFSKTPEETFQKWQGHDIALGDMVRVVRTFRPDVLVARFSGTERDGHGHHQASAILTREAFHAAADPKRFPEQIAEGLKPWQPMKLYIGNVCGFGAATCDAGNYTLRLNTGTVDPALGTSYIQFAMKGLRHQLSQGSGSWTVEPGDRFTFYKLVDSVGAPKDNDKNKDGHEQSFFDGIDTSLPGLARRLGDDEKKVLWLGGELASIASDIKQAADKSEPNADYDSVADSLSKAVRNLDSVMTRLSQSGVGNGAKEDVLAILREKRDEAQGAVNLALGVSFRASVASLADPGKTVAQFKDALTVISPTQKFQVIATLHNGSKYWLIVEDARVNVSEDDPGNWVRQTDASEMTIKPGENYYANFALQVPADAARTGPYWHRDNPETEALNTVDVEKYATLPLPPPPLRVSLRYETAEKNGGRSPVPDVLRRGPGKASPTGEISAKVLVPFVDDAGRTDKTSLSVAPALSVSLEPNEQVLPVANEKEINVKVGVSSNLTGAPTGNLRLTLPDGWKAEPRELPVSLAKRGDKQDFQFKVFPASLQEGRTEVRAVLDAGGKTYSDGYTLVTREDLGATYYYQPATQHVSVVDVKVPKDLKVGYIMGAGDEIPTVLEQIGVDVTLIPAEKLGSEDLSHYQTIVLGIRAYDTQKDVIGNNKRLLDFVQAGGRLVVQYNTLGSATGDFNAGKFTPYPATLGRARVSVEEAPVAILDRASPIFHSPNEITQKDFDGWVQERGLYFMTQWDSNFTPLLESHDPGESEQKGGLLIAHYGKGTYIYTGYAFFRQLPAGVPGAVRLFVNLISGR